jgi:hypothetical protein
MFRLEKSVLQPEQATLALPGQPETLQGPRQTPHSLGSICPPLPLSPNPTRTPLTEEVTDIEDTLLPSAAPL